MTEMCSNYYIRVSFKDVIHFSVEVLEHPGLFSVNFNTRRNMAGDQNLNENDNKTRNYL